MDCPKCMGKLSPVYVGDIELDRCYVCEGLWFDPGELEEILDKYAGNLENMSIDGRLFDGKETYYASENYNLKHGDCPKCKSKMFYRKYGDVTADACPRGHGIWLDGGEIFLLKKIEERNFLGLFKYIFSFKSVKKETGAEE